MSSLLQVLLMGSPSGDMARHLHTQSDASLDTMRIFNLCAVNTYFKPKKNCSNATYLAPKISNEISTAGQQYVGRKVSAKYKREVSYSGVVCGMQLAGGGEYLECVLCGWLCRRLQQQAAEKTAVVNRKERHDCDANRLHLGVSTVAIMCAAIKSLLGTIYT